MAEAFGDELFSVFEEDAAAAASGAKKSKTGPAEGARRPGKRLEEKPSIPAIVKPKREIEIDSTENVVLGKKPKLEDVLSEDVNLTDLMPQVKVQSVETVEGCTHERKKLLSIWGCWQYYFRDVVARRQDLELDLAEFHTVGLCPLIQSVLIPLQSFPALQKIQHFILCLRS